MLSELALRFLIGGLVVSAFAVVGDVLKPKSFAGLFGAAPSVALATLGITIAKHGGEYAATEGRSMIIGAIALFAYSHLSAWLLMRKKWHALTATMSSFAIWFTVSFAMWFAMLR
jgi:hypothetical protein